MSAPSATTASIPAQGFQPRRPTKMPMTTVRKPKIEPIDMSISPTTNRNVMPTDKLPRSATWRSVLSRFSAVRKRSTEKLKIAKITIPVRVMTKVRFSSARRQSCALWVVRNICICRFTLRRPGLRVRQRGWLLPFLSVFHSHFASDDHGYNLVRRGRGLAAKTGQRAPAQHHEAVGYGKNVVHVVANDDHSAARRP